MTVPILFEDNHLLAVEKPVNMPVQEDQSGDFDLLNLLKQMIKERDEKPGNVYLGLVHRLDRPVGGVMVFAKTSKAASRLSDQIRRNVWTKQYLAVVRGVPRNRQGRLEHDLVKDKQQNQVYVSSSGEKEAKKAILNYQVLAKKDGLALLQVDLQTGRSHQIRVQLSTIGCPIYGDQKYGSIENKPGQQLALWSQRLGIEHPTQKDECLFTSEPPNSYPWQGLMN